ncbi:MAG: hypothetical protein ABFD97_22785 [Syntrophobacter sp.]
MGKGDMDRRCVTGITMGVYFVIVLALSFFQLGYINADFVAYITVTHRILDASGPVITGYWSPLFSWLMLPLAWAGVRDILAGRIVLILGGALYVFAALRFMHNLLEHDRQFVRTALPAYSICVILQAAIWATFLLDPDILADGLLFLYFSIIVDPALIRSRRGEIGAGLAAGFAYLAKAYMLPFVAIHLAATLTMRFFAKPEPGSFRLKSLLPSFRAGCLVLAAMLLVAGPWIAALTSHYGKLVFSTAGTFNHANMGPWQFEKDPLWNPGLIPDYMADPHLDAGWSPIAGWSEFLHQGKITIRNITNGFGHVFPWIVFLATGAILRSRRAGRSFDVDSQSLGAVRWCIVSIVLYYSGYWLINNEARYIAPVVSPLLCIAGLILIGKWLGARHCTTVMDAVGSNGDTTPSREQAQVKTWKDYPMLCLALLVLVASSQDFHRIYRIIGPHAQSARLDTYVDIAQRLKQAGLLPAPFAASQWHHGMFIAYAGECSRLYMGAPLATGGMELATELGRTQAAVYLRLVSQRQLGRQMPGEAYIAPGWKFAMVINDLSAGEMGVEVYTRKAP